MLNYNPANKFGIVEVRIDGEKGMFSRPESRTNRMSGPVPTCSALEQLVKNIYWHPVMDVRITRLKILSEIQYTSKMFNHRGDRNIKQANQTYLLNPSYLVRAILFWDEDRADLAHERIAGKHYSIMTRRIGRGVSGYPTLLGTTECIAEISALEKPWDEYVSPLVGQNDFGLLYYHKNFKTGGHFMKPVVALNGEIDYSDTTDIIRIK